MAWQFGMVVVVRWSRLDQQMSSRVIAEMGDHLGENPVNWINSAWPSISGRHNEYEREMGKVAVGLASHWSCVTDDSDISAFCIKAQQSYRDKIVKFSVTRNLHKVCC